MEIRVDEPLVLTDLVDGILILTLNDPRRRNPISGPMRDALIEALETVALDDDVSAVVLTGAEGAFSSGGDLAGMPPATAEDSDLRMARVKELLLLVSDSKKPMIAAIEGPAAGVSVGLAAVCDYVIMAVGAKIMFPFTRLGLVPDGGIMASLGQRIGRAAAKRVLMLGNPVETVSAVSLGLADESVADGEALSRAIEVARELSNRAPQSLTAIKEFFSAGELEVRDALDAEIEIQRNLYFSQDFAEGKSAFFEKRQPKFTGR